MRIDWQRLWPAYWVQIQPTDWEWDEILNQLLDLHEPVMPYAGSQTVFLGDVEVWAANWAYAYGECYRPKHKGLPSVATRKRLREAIRPVTPKTIDAVRAAAKL